MTSDVDAPCTVRCTEHEALHDLAGVLQLCAAGKLRCSEKTRRPSAATVRAIAETLVGGDFYPDEAIASFAGLPSMPAGHPANSVPSWTSGRHTRCRSWKAATPSPVG